MAERPKRWSTNVAKNESMSKCLNQEVLCFLEKGSLYFI